MGANGTIGVEAVAKSLPDGYTILVTIDTVASNPHVFKTNIDPTKDLVPIIQLSRQSIVLAAHPSLGVSSIAELIVLAKQQPGLRYATGSGVGSPQHMAVQWFAQIAGLMLEQVPYRGGGQAINDLIGGHVKLGSLGSTPLIPHYKAGTLRLLAQTTEARSPSRLNSEIGKALADPAVRKNFFDSAQEPIGGTVDQFSHFVSEDFAKFGRLVKQLDIRGE
jgi:tripartite-type tricarboxylate transporter receptor subunit TctC